MKTELRKFDQLPNEGPTQVSFSPDGSLFFTGISVEPKKESNLPTSSISSSVSSNSSHSSEKQKTAPGLLLFFDTKTLSVSQQVAVGSGSSVYRAIWHPKLNQIVCGGHNSSIYVFYDPNKSKNGIFYFLFFIFYFFFLF